MSAQRSKNSDSLKDQRYDPPRAPVVVLQDENTSRREAIAEVIAACGGGVHIVETPAQIADLDCAEQDLALVALGKDSLANETSLSQIAALKTRQLKVIAYADGVFSWPIGIRCRALLNGAILLLDSQANGFSAELREAVKRILRDQNERHNEETEIKEQMRRMGIVGASSAMLSVFRSVIRFGALSDFPLLISGETGTGKELIARSLYRLDVRRSKGPFVVANCSAISSGLAESELFGHRRGAFTGADAERKGLFRSADGGVLFLDEIGELSPAIQAKLLRVLQEDRVLAVGYDREVPIDVRVIAATNKNLVSMVQENTFREDLYHRLNVLAVHVPPLRERPEDLQPLVEHFLAKYSSLNHAAAAAVGDDFLEALGRMELSGNVRQLENIVRRALLSAQGKTSLSLNDLTNAELQQLVVTEPANTVDSAATSPNSQIGFTRILDLNDWNLSKSLDYCERRLLECAMRFTHGNQSQTARLMGITPRSVYNKLQKHKLRYP